MTDATRALTATLLVLLANVAAWADTSTDHVHVDAFADTSEVQFGRPFQIAVQLRIDPGWHVYWTNPGDSGLPTRVTLNLPDGFTAGEVQYPVPTILHLPGGITDYGYEGEAVLLVPVTLPRVPGVNAPSAPFGFGVNVDYLVCRENCVPGKAAAFFTLDTSEHPEPTHRRLFHEATARLPADLDAAAAEYDHTAAATAGGDARVAIRWRPELAARLRSVEYVPPAVPGCDLERVAASTEGGVTRVRYAIADPTTASLPARADGVLAVTCTDGTRLGFVVPIYPSDKPAARRHTVYGSRQPVPAVGAEPVPPDRRSP